MYLVYWYFVSPVHFYVISDAKGHLQCSMGLDVLFKGITGENFRSNTGHLQLAAHSQQTPLSAMGINPTTFRLLVYLHAWADLGRGARWVRDRCQMCARVYVCG